MVLIATLRHRLSRNFNKVVCRIITDMNMDMDVRIMLIITTTRIYYLHLLPHS